MNDINPAVLTGQGLPDSNPFKVREEAEENASVDAIAERKRKKIQEQLRKTDYIDDLLEKSEIGDDDNVTAGDDDLYE